MPSGASGRPARCMTRLSGKCRARFRISRFPSSLRAKTGMEMPICSFAFFPTISRTAREAQDQTMSQLSASDSGLGLADAGGVNGKDEGPHAQFFPQLPQSFSVACPVARHGYSDLLEPCRHRLLEAPDLIDAALPVEKQAPSLLKSVLRLSYRLGLDQAGHVGTHGLQDLRPCRHECARALADEHSRIHQPLAHGVRQDLGGPEADGLLSQLQDSPAGRTCQAPACAFAVCLPPSRGFPSRSRRDRISGDRSEPAAQ